MTDAAQRTNHVERAGETVTLTTNVREISNAAATTAGLNFIKNGICMTLYCLGWGSGFGPCLVISHPTHPYLGEISPKKRFIFTPSLKSEVKKQTGRWWHCLREWVRKEPGKIVPFWVKGVKRNHFFWGDFSQMWVGGVADSQTRSKPLRTLSNHP